MALRSPIEVVGRRYRARSVEHDDELVRIVVRKRAKEHGVDDAENGGVGADAESEREYGGDGESGATTERTESEAYVLEDALEQSTSADFADSGGERFDTTGFDEGLTTGLVGCDSAANFLSGEQFDVGVELGIKIA